MHTLYPPIKPYREQQLRVSNDHILHLEETGSPEGIPVIVLHANPGGGGDIELRRFFDPQHYRIIRFDPRGSGLSTPHASLTENTTLTLLDDIETIRDYLKLPGFILFGGAFGALLALLYAERYPQYVNALLLNQIFLGRRKDIDWFYHYGTSQLSPDYWQEFAHFVPEDKRKNIPLYYYQSLQGNNELARMAAAKNWALWQARCSSLQPHLSILDHYNDPHFALTLASIESHYVINGYFIEDNEVLNNAHKIRHIPCYLVHGRYDIISPLENALSLHQALPASNLRIIRDAGHSDREAGIIDALVEASWELLKQNMDAS